MTSPGESAHLAALAAALSALFEQLAASCADDSFIRLTLAGPLRELNACATDEAAEKVLVRLIALQGTPHFSLTFRYPQRDTTRNLPLAAGLAWVHAQLAPGGRNALLCTTTRDWQLVAPNAGKTRLVSHPPSRTAAPARVHDQAKATFLGDSARDWLQALAVVDAHGKVRPGLADKHHQISRYLEILSHLAQDCGWAGPAANAAAPVTLADMGCGKGYLTFGTWHLFQRVWQRPVRVIGIETRPDLATAADALAQRIKAPGLSFVAGTISSVTLPRVDALVALHACNTATDDAIRRGVASGARLIVVAPCCHQEVRPQLGRPEPLAAVLRHGIMAERLAEWATDGLRGLFLEWAGYRTKLIEFVASEHTPKNLLLAGVRHGEPFSDPAARERILQFKSFFGIARHALDPLLETAGSAENRPPV